MAVPGEKFCLRWNDFESNISGAFQELREDKDFFDVTLACDDDQIEAHKVILSACSPFFRSILRRNKHEHPLLYLKGVKYTDLASVLNFMYHGEVNVAQEELNSFLAVAEDLKVKGLTQNGSDSMSMNVPQEKNQLHDNPAKLSSAPPPKRFRPSPSAVPRLTPSTYQADDEIQEVVPVKSEPMPAEIQIEDQAYSVAGLESGVVDTPTDNAEEYEDYAGYEEDGGYGETRQKYSHHMGQPGSTGVVESLLDHEMTEGRATLTAEATKTAAEDSVTADVDILLEKHISRQLGSDRTDYVCLLCSKVCKSRDECANHIEVHHLKIVRSCPYCAIELTSRGGLRQHISRKHREEHRLSKLLPEFGNLNDKF